MFYRRINKVVGDYTPLTLMSNADCGLKTLLEARLSRASNEQPRTRPPAFLE